MKERIRQDSVDAHDLLGGELRWSARRSTWLVAMYAASAVWAMPTHSP